MATIRFIREDLEVQCNPGENLRELVMKENLQLYGLKGILGNCGGAGQCSTCFISVEGGNKNSLREWCDNQSQKFDDKKFSDLFYEQLESVSKKLSTFSKKIGKNIEDLEIDDLVLLVKER